MKSVGRAGPALHAADAAKAFEAWLVAARVYRSWRAAAIARPQPGRGPAFVSRAHSEEGGKRRQGKDGVEGANRATPNTQGPGVPLVVHKRDLPLFEALRDVRHRGRLRTRAAWAALPAAFAACLQCTLRRAHFEARATTAR